jgi:hypothetical protein
MANKELELQAPLKGLFEHFEEISSICGYTNPKEFVQGLQKASRRVLDFGARGVRDGVAAIADDEYIEGLVSELQRAAPAKV